MNNADYKNPSVPVEQRIKDLMSKMTLEEKLAQLTGAWNGGVEDFDETFFSDAEMLKKTFGNGINSVHPAFKNIKDTVENRNRIQKYLIEETRLGIPALFVDEGQHGLMRREATVFPQAIGMACSWDPELFQKIYGVIAHEMRSRGTHHALTPVIDVCRDPRWGRVEETYGEDPYLNSILSTAAVKGLQGTDNGQVANNNVAATLKHLVGHGQPEGGVNQAPANYSRRVLHEFHMPPFKYVIEHAKPVSVMPSYNEVDGIPSHANKWLLQDLLRKEWDFKGMIVSDYYAVDHLFGRHFVAHDGKEAAMMAFNTGIQYEFPVANYYNHLPELLQEGKIKQEDIDNSVYQVLELKFKLGLFEHPFIDLVHAINVSKEPVSRELALKAAHESIVLLKNNGILPIQKNKYKKIAVIGPCGKDVFFGGYAGEPYQKIGLLEGIQNKVDGKTKVLFAQGCKLTENSDISQVNWKTDEIIVAKKEDNLKLIKEAVKVAKKSDLVILAIGENDQLCREAWAPTHLGDNMTLDLFGQQEDLAKAIVETGKPVVVYLMNGRPLSVNYLEEHSAAIIEGWYMGQETGTAAADVIFGDVNPSGKLTITFPKSVGQLPMYYNHKPSAQSQDYLSMDIKPLFAFGYGLSYTQFKYGFPVLENETIKTSESTRISIEITNNGKVDGDEIVQMYIRDKVSSVTRPVKELKGFQRINLKAGESKNVFFAITPDKLAFYNADYKFIVEPGEFEIMVGSSSRDEDLQKVVLIVEK